LADIGIAGGDLNAVTQALRGEKGDLTAASPKSRGRKTAEDVGGQDPSVAPAARTDPADA
jgi:hypothetical protein